MIDSFAKSVEYYLPVYLPLMLTVLSVVSGVATKRIPLESASLLKLHGDLAMGVFSFIVWALSTFQQTGKIALNNDVSISMIRVILLLIANLIFLFVGLIVLQKQWATSDRFSAAQKEHAWNAALTGVALFLFFLPLTLAVKVPAGSGLHSFRVAIPYYDETVQKQLGSSRWGARLMSEQMEVLAKDEHAAREAALKEFNGSNRAFQLFSGKSEPVPVVIRRDQIVVQRIRQE